MELYQQNDINNNNSIITIDTILNNNREQCDITRADMERSETKLSRNDSSELLPNVIYRFKFTTDFMEELYNFSKIHQYDERKDFKEAWTIWTEENDEIIQQEIARLEKLGYEGDIMDKMFKSARYYFRKKSTEKKEPKQRRQYISVPRELLDSMDRHIEEYIYDSNYQPKTGFLEFCKNNEEILKDTVAKIYEQGVKDSNIIEDKIKKTYKNRYFMLTQSKNK